MGLDDTTVMFVIVLVFLVVGILFCSMGLSMIIKKPPKKGVSNEELLIKLKGMYIDGKITEEEFLAKKSNLVEE